MESKASAEEPEDYGSDYSFQLELENGPDPVTHEVEEKKPNKPEYRSFLPRKQQRF